MIAKFVGSIVCRFRGHLRGKQVESLDNGRTKRFSCPRCKRVTSYKARDIGAR